MKHDPARAYPHPVLRPGSNDYEKVEFEVDIELTRIPKTTRIGVEANAQLSDKDLQGLVESGNAEYVILVRAIQTQFRSAFRCGRPVIKHQFANGEVAGRVEISPLLVCKSRIHQFRASRWHRDYGGMAFDLKPGDLLAIDETKEYWVDMEEEVPVSSIIRLDRNDRLSEGSWQCRLGEQKVVLEMSPKDHEQFMAIRDRVNSTGDAIYLMNSIYLPALTWVLMEADKDPDSFSDYRWYRSLDSQLEANQLKPIGTCGNRLVDAQRLLQRPFEKLLARAGRDEP